MIASRKRSFVYSNSICLVAALTVLSSCGGSSDSEYYTINGESYCDELNQVIDLSLQIHLTKSEVDREELYDKSMKELRDYLNRRVEEIPPENEDRRLESKLSRQINSGVDQTGKFPAQNLSQCQDLKTAHIAFNKEVQRAGSQMLDDRSIYWVFLHYYLGNLDYFSRYSRPYMTNEKNQFYGFGLRLDLDLATHFNHIQREAKILSIDPKIAEREKIQVGDLVTHIDSTSLVEEPSFSDLRKSFLFGYSLYDITKEKLGRLVESIFQYNTSSDLILTIKSQNSEAEPKTVYLSGDLYTSGIERVPFVQAELKEDIIYARLFEFESGAAMELSNKISDLKTRWLTERSAESPSDSSPARQLSIILDLRFNPGGSSYEASRIAGLFLPSGRYGTIVERDPQSKGLAYVESAREAIFTGVNFTEPLIVLINNGSASASDGLAQMLSETERAFVVGTPSYGKGIQQSGVYLGALSKLGGSIWITTGQFYGPSGKTVQLNGFEPDLLIEDPLVSSLIEECRRDKERECSLQFMKDVPAEEQISPQNFYAGPIRDLRAVSNIQTQFTNEQLRAVTEPLDIVRGQQAEGFDIQRSVAERLLKQAAETSDHP